MQYLNVLANSLAEPLAPAASVVFSPWSEELEIPVEYQVFDVHNFYFYFLGGFSQKEQKNILHRFMISGTILTGQTVFKRATLPIDLGGTPWSVEAMQRRLLHLSKPGWTVHLSLYLPTS